MDRIQTKRNSIIDVGGNLSNALYKDYNNNLNFNLMSDKSSKIKDTDEYKESRKRWHNRLKSDIYIDESINVLLNLKTKKIENNNILAKVG